MPSFAFSTRVLYFASDSLNLLSAIAALLILLKRINKNIIPTPTAITVSIIASCQLGLGRVLVAPIKRCGMSRISLRNETIHSNTKPLTVRIRILKEKVFSFRVLLCLLDIFMRISPRYIHRN